MSKIAVAVVVWRFSSLELAFYAVDEGLEAILEKAGLILRLALASAFLLVIDGQAALAAPSCVADDDNTLSASCNGPFSWTSGDLSVAALTTVNGGKFNGIYIGLTSVVGTLNNNGTVKSGYNGIGNDGIVDSIINNSVIAGGYNGISNNGTINSVFNNGTVSGGYYGVSNQGTITLLNNSGSLEGGGVNIYTSGAIGTLVNSSTVSNAGFDAIDVASTGSIGTIENSGTIAGAILNESSSRLSFIGGTSGVGTLTGTVTGSVGTITSLNSDVAFVSGNIALNDSVNLGSNTLNNAAAMLIDNAVSPIVVTGNLVNTGSVTVNNGATFTTSQTFTNQGTVALSHATLNAGTYMQAGGTTTIDHGTLDPTRITITGGLFKADSGILDGPVSLSGGTLEIGPSGLTATGSFTQSGGAIDFDIAETAGGFTHGIFTAPSFMLSGGTLEFTLVGVSQTGQLTALGAQLFGLGSTQSSDLAALLGTGTVTGKFSNVVVLADLGGTLDETTVTFSPQGVVTGETQVSAVPLPGALSLFLSALLAGAGVMGLARVRQASPIETARLLSR